MGYGKITNKGMSTALTSGAIILGAMGLMAPTDNFQNDINKSIAAKINKVLGNPNARVAQIQTDTKKGSLNKLDGNTASSYTTYHSAVWNYCEEWIGDSSNGICARWLDPYVSPHGFAESDKSALEGTMANLYGQMRGQKSQDSWTVFDVQGNGQDPVYHTSDPNRLNVSGLTKFELKKEVQAEVEKIGTGTAMENIADGIDKDEPVETMPNNEVLRALANSYTQTFRNNLMGMLGSQRRMKPGIEAAGAENMVECEAFLNNPDELKIKNYNQEELSRVTPKDQEGIQKRIALCRQMLDQSAQAVNPVVKDEQIVSGDAKGENIDEAKTRLNLLAVDDVTTDVNSAPKPASLELTPEETKSKIVINQDGKEQIVYETPKETIEAYNQMLKRAAEAQSAVAKMTMGHIPDGSGATLQNQIQGSISAMEMNDLTRAQKQRLANEKIGSANSGPPPMTPNELMQLGR